MPNSNEPTRTYNDIPPLTAAELGGVIARVVEGEEIIGNVPLPVPVNKGGTNATTASTARTNLGLGSIATQNSNSVAITGGSISGIDPLPIASGGTNATTAPNARTNLGLGTLATQNANAVAITGGSGTFSGSLTLSTNSFSIISAFSYATAVACGLLLAYKARGIDTAPEPVQSGDRVFVFAGVPRHASGWSGTGTGMAVFARANGQSYTTSVPCELRFDGPNLSGTTSTFFTAHSDEIRFLPTTESTSTTTGAVRIDGGLGIVKNLNIGGNLRFAGGTVPATATSAGTTGDVRYDGSHLYICTATNTWRRTALSTW
jgi:hypothetical protein